MIATDINNGCIQQEVASDQQGKFTHLPIREAHIDPMTYFPQGQPCLLYTSDAADDLLQVLISVVAVSL